MKTVCNHVANGSTVGLEAYLPMLRWQNRPLQDSLFLILLYLVRKDPRAGGFPFDWGFVVRDQTHPHQGPALIKMTDGHNMEYGGNRWSDRTK